MNRRHSRRLTVDRLLLIPVSFCVVAMLLAGQASAASFGPASPPRAYRWLIGFSALVRLEPIVGSVRLRAYFDNPGTIVIVGKNQPRFLNGWHSTRALSFTSYAAMRTYLTGNSVDPRIRAVVYDAEAWPLTPRAEQSEPARYTALAASLVHRCHLLLIATPATNLASVARPDANSKYQTFIRLRLARQVAQYADIYDIQAQGSESNLPVYREFVSQAAAQARKGNRHVDVLAGLSSNPTGHVVSAQALFQAVMATRHVASGYWLNIPAASVYCPSCGAPRPQVAADLLTLLSGSVTRSG